MEKINRGILTIILSIMLVVVLIGFAGAQPIATISQYIEIKDISVFDSAGKERTTFSSSEKIGFSVTCDNQLPVERIYFQFYVYDAKGVEIFRHTGNSAVGNVGTGSSSIRNIPISRFYKSPGKYFYMAKVIAGSQSDSPEAASYMVFYVYSPSITLSYPANGARDLIDKPLTFRWVSSGATKYRVYVDDDKGFYNTLFQTGRDGYTDPVTTYFQYPTSPKDPRQKLAGGVVYWWKVEGLDSQGNVVAKTPVPFSFTLKETAPSVTTKDLAVTDIILDEESTASELKFNVLVKNQGGMAISNTRVNLYVNGVPVIPYQLLNFINTGKEETLTFLGGAVKQKMVIVSAAIDDNIKNNMLTEVFTLTPEYRHYEPWEVWKIIKRFVRDLEILKELEGYTLSEVTLIPQGDIGEELEKLEQGKAKVVGVEIEVVK
jgi:uncharacterized protein YcfL